MKRHLLFSLILLAGFIVFPFFSFAQDKVTLTLFHGEECPHCQAERAFLKDLKKEIPQLEVKEYEVWHNEENQKLLLETAQKLGIEQLAVPLTIIADKYLIGFDTSENYGQKIREMVNAEIEKMPVSTSTSGVIVPFFGKINPENFSLPVLTVVLGTLDGFNPCSMWSLLTLLTLVLATGSRRKVWLAGWTFIFISSVSYFLFMVAWLNAFIFFGYLTFIRIIVGIIALGAGIFSLKEFFTFKPNVCEITTPDQQRKISERILKAVSSPTTIALVVGVILVALSVNLVELLCSLGLPVVFTKTLAMHNLPGWQYYLYILFYDFFYMLDDIIVVLIVGFTMRFWAGSNKFAKWSHLVAGILMLFLGLAFLINPGLLMF